MPFLLVVAMIFSLATAYATENAVPEPLDVKMSIVNGQVELARVGKSLSDVFSARYQLGAGDIIETMQESKAELVYQDGTTMRMKPLTKVEVQPTSLKIFKGNTWHKFTKRGTEFLIETPSLVAGIRGTTFDVAVSSKGKSILAGVEGKGGVRGAEGGELLITDGKYVGCEPGYAPGAPLIFDVDKKKAEWNEAEWKTVTNDDISQRLANYINLKSEYGPSDPRTIEALKHVEEAKKAMKQKKTVAPKQPKVKK